MIELTAVAEKKIKQYLTENNIDSAVRVFAMNGCSGPSLGLSLDEQKEGDSVTEIGSLRILIRSDLTDMCGKVKIDFIEPSRSGCGCGTGAGGGFSLSSERPLPHSGGSCEGTCSSKSCGC
ncbi:MAG: hypothetical protein BM485_12860 [Desulfobulbaceae bacterium DB1]|nr:MAG: hypothetical protein BM485_12860 [Desulfobulbaceae bacterium DB1]